MEVKARHHSQNRVYREPFGAVACGQKVVIRLQTSATVEQCWLRIWETESEREKLIPMHIPNQSDFDPRTGTLNQGIFLKRGSNSTDSEDDWDSESSNILFEGEFNTPASPGLVWYYFVIKVEGQQFYYGNNEEQLGGIGQVKGEQPPSWQITVYNPMQIPEWYRRGIIYQIFVDRFYKGESAYSEQEYVKNNALVHMDWEDTPFYIKDEKGRVTHWDFFGGNLDGILQKLPYLQGLGVSILYLNPIFEAVSNHKYDTGDYHKIDPMFGNDEIFDRLVTRAKHYGISIILDGVFSHTGRDSLYFNRYGHYPEVGAYQSPDSPYYAWYRFKPGSHEYKSWWDIKDLPEVDEMNSSYRQFIYGTQESVIQKWMRKGVAGWRLDVADELPDEFIQELRQAVKTSNPEAVLIGEVWENASNKMSYGKLRQYFWGQELDGTMNYPFREIFLNFLLGEWDSFKAHRHVMSLYETYPRENFYALMNLMGSHDRIRILTVLGGAPSEGTLSDSERRTFRLSPSERQLALQRLKLFSLIQMMFPGVPSIYYGDEAGLEGYADPYNRGTFPWGKEDLDIENWFRRLIRWRKEYEVLQTGDFQSYYYGQDVYGLQRAGGGEAVTVLINRNPSVMQEVELNLDIQDRPLIIDLMSGEVLAKGDQEKLTVHIEPLSSRVFFAKKNFHRQTSPQLSRASGVLLHISSLPSPWGTGDLGNSSFRFVDFLSESHQRLWQVLPLNPVGPGNSPYQSDSVFAGNPMLISFDSLIREGILQAEMVRDAFAKNFSTNESPDLEALKPIQDQLLRNAFEAFTSLLEKQKASSVTAKPTSASTPVLTPTPTPTPTPISIPTYTYTYTHTHTTSTSSTSWPSEQTPYLTLENYEAFVRDNLDWLEDYALFRALKTHFRGVPWFDWNCEIALRIPEKLSEYAQKLVDEIEYNRFLQYTFYFQWQELKNYASRRDIKIIGDMPLYVASDSCDVWVNRRLFKLDKNGKPSKVAGVPPDYFSKTGQRWDNPVYEWGALAATQYSWWKKRIKQTLKLFDYTRVDHFRGLEAYWEIDAGEETAIKGCWLKGPGKRFLESLIEEFEELPLIAEDLGVITPEVDTLRQIFGFPGMKVLQFTPLSKGEIVKESQVIYYSGTHDNDTLLGWYTSKFSVEGVDETKSKLACRSLIEKLYLSEATWVILPLQDILGLGNEARMNVPGTVGDNWQWQVAQELLTDEVKEYLQVLTRSAHRD